MRVAVTVLSRQLQMVDKEISSRLGIGWWAKDLFVKSKVFLSTFDLARFL
jgi:hypothetical protein